MKYQATTCVGEPAGLEHNLLQMNVLLGGIHFLGGAGQRSRAAAL